MGTIVATVILVAAVALAIRSIMKNKGKCNCGKDCENCKECNKI